MNRPSAPPNIIVILVDDMGYSDIGCYGSEIQTPNLNALARNGLRGTQMYNCARCCPTRASLLTGLYPHQAGVGHMVQNRETRAYQGYLRDDCVTVAEALKMGGYQTFMSGKWHVGGHYIVSEPENWDPGGEGHPTPTTRGFDEFFGTLEGAGSFFHPYTVMRSRAGEAGDFIRGEYGQVEDTDFYYTDAISDNACAMIDKASQTDAPFFLYVAFTAPHWPLHALPEDIAKYEGQYRNGGWDTLRTSRHEELKGLGILDSKWEISPRDEQAPAWDDAPDRNWEDLRMAIYAAQIDRMDQGVGQVVNKLRELGLLDNTLIMFMSDNGGCAEFLAEDGGIQRYQYHTADGTPIRVGNIRDLRPGGPDTFMSYDLPWANASNSPFRLYKHWVHEGGISTPLIAHWPNGIEANQIKHEPCHVIDIMATCLDVAGVQYPDEYNGNAIQPLEGESMAPLFRGESWTRERPIFWEHEGNRAVRWQEWKLVSKHPGNWELYNINEDRTELNNLFNQSQDCAQNFIRQYDEWAARCEVRPWPLS
ncbi:arylsulfatase [Chloroflexi bacterium TSY]|nr:arylsulfatase [Chloroflexi bacterium TSY]